MDERSCSCCLADSRSADPICDSYRSLEEDDWPGWDFCATCEHDKECHEVVDETT